MSDLPPAHTQTPNLLARVIIWACVLGLLGSAATFVAELAIGHHWAWGALEGLALTCGGLFLVSWAIRESRTEPASRRRGRD